MQKNRCKAIVGAERGEYALWETMGTLQEGTDLGLSKGVLEDVGVLSTLLKTHDIDFEVTTGKGWKEFIDMISTLPTLKLQLVSLAENGTLIRGITGALPNVVQIKKSEENSRLEGSLHLHNKLKDVLPLAIMYVFLGTYLTPTLAEKVLGVYSAEGDIQVISFLEKYRELHEECIQFCKKNFLEWKNIVECIQGKYTVWYDFYEEDIAVLPDTKQGKIRVYSLKDSYNNREENGYITVTSAQFKQVYDENLWKDLEWRVFGGVKVPVLSLAEGDDEIYLKKFLCGEDVYVDSHPNDMTNI